MPHLLVEYANNIALPLDETLNALHETLVQSGQFDPQDIKIRAQSHADYRVGGTKASGFVHLTLHLMAGRKAEIKAELSQNLAQTIAAKLPEYTPTGTQITVQMQDIERESYHKIIL
ncbi:MULTISPECIES: 5-carboxymethyl-2-hydroxymuconate Delta-isomerase [Alysiella]|uniref:5-carboxymethyl-2-hydroxymuconate delta-isomerase n=2 Tax=Alysiella TaxID=194195 RepID=A0A376BKV0_9NEIS|nr:MULTISPECIES: 5-carboxymethyl-2-hydroxymuconate Delta-isomerase [Alysiella]QMT31487.1 5-carboxymethyl-2-hydroxymuconate Delta-isomerase [Alysiella filiformis]UBQ55502.1 5-carboxymethyl-2-hydroxymuconate Delta-isomerase [Alysiella filiformis DSM 16848]UOP07415.1 5-carboxymethyl-2-hydroxymuconate Delta-isomerase [Alysiella crassa]SOD66468.1 5-carboxymethyl-2-hydroxymuconate isomerase [Alysiella filiformis DSM 16848]SSY70397.1 5-carboxymethyl-2-hydroxymuconate delta-isomerase [Alysiella crassa